MKILLVYHFFHPDKVISARLFSDLAEDLTKAGHEVTVYTGNRLIRSPEKLPEFTEWNGVRIKRFSRPDFSQGSNFGRLFNSFILQEKWILSFFREGKNYDCVIAGTDPQFVYLMFPFLRLANRKIRLIHWGFDIYPEAILANSPLWMRALAVLTKPFARISYKQVDDMVDIGSCMRNLLSKYHHKAACATLTPWALVEPETIPDADPVVRKELFGDAKLGILYSGTVGYAHDLGPFIELARECRKRNMSVAFCFAGYGNQYKAQTAKITEEDTNIRMAGFTSEEELGKRLAAADIHMISLRKGWEGIVIPSKFFGALAIGRPVLFSGPKTCAISQWCSQYDLGTTVDGETAEWLRKLLDSPENLQTLKENTFHCYQQHFSRQKIVAGWLELLKTGKKG